MKVPRPLVLLFLPLALIGQSVAPHVGETFWRLSHTGGIVWDAGADLRLPHADHMEMSGRRVAAIIDYQVDAKGGVTVRREVFYPQLRVFPRKDSPDWFDYRAYLKETYTDEVVPVLLIERVRQLPAQIERIEIDGMLHLIHQVQQGVAVERTLLPSMSERLLVEHWTVRNVGPTTREVEVLPVSLERAAKGPDGEYRLLVRTIGDTAARALQPGEARTFAVTFEALAQDEAPTQTTPDAVMRERQRFLSDATGSLQLRSPNPVLNTLFRFAKIRAAESIYESRLGLIHSPGGGNYYVGVWANDQAEYSGPFFPYLGYPTGNEAALNAYRTFRDRRPRNGGKIFASFEMQGDLPCCSKDRGDAAMLAYGASHYALATGDPEVGREVWPLVEWALDYCNRQLNAAGVVESDTDEMEGRIPTGDANLATSSLYYGALQFGTILARELGQDPAYIAELEHRAHALAVAIEKHFGADIAGLRTYRYFDGHTALRHWISLPLAMGLTERAPDTVTALLDRMWSPNGVRVEWSPSVPDRDLFWDRGTLYALRATFLAGAADRTLERLEQYSNTRLLGFHVPYPIEAWPENNMRHLSAESALYCRIFTEGLLGMRPAGFDRFTLRPVLPNAWAQQGYSLENVRLLGRDWDISIHAAAEPGMIRVEVSSDGRTWVNTTLSAGDTIEVQRP